VRTITAEHAEHVETFNGVANSAKLTVARSISVDGSAAEHAEYAEIFDGVGEFGAFGG
jgi:hypothetical protein